MAGVFVIGSVIATSCDTARNLIEPADNTPIESSGQTNFCCSGCLTEMHTLEDVEVYVTQTGSKYHRSGCQYLRKSKISIPLTSAKYTYGPCSRCRPPR